MTMNFLLMGSGNHNMKREMVIDKEQVRLKKQRGFQCTKP